MAAGIVGRPISTEQFDLFMLDMPVLLDAFDSRGLIKFWNRECERVTGYSAGEMIDNPEALCMLYPDPAYLADLLANCERRGAAQVWSLRAKNGVIRSIAWTDVLVDRSSEGQWEWGFGLDITERVKLQAAFDDATERERQRLGQELHDGLGQTLTGLSMILHSLVEGASSEEGALTERLKQASRIATQAVNSCRNIAMGLLPVEDGALCAALRGLVREVQLQASGVSVEFEQFQEAELRLSPPNCGHLFRMVQESLSNAIQHSRADRIRVVVRVTQEWVTLVLQDNGRGIPETSGIRSGLGMRTLHDRAAVVDARVHIRRLADGGTQVEVECPNRRQTLGA